VGLKLAKLFSSVDLLALYKLFELGWFFVVEVVFDVSPADFYVGLDV
jgi:hypothetical protein